MAKFFNEQKWEESIRKFDWYLELVPELEQMKKKAEEGGREMVEQYKKEVYGFFEYHLKAGNIMLGGKKGNWDKERKPVDTIIIHHTQNPSGMTKEFLSAMELIRLYAPVYENPSKKDLSQTFGEPISSGHIRDGKQVFYPYHWIVRMDATVERCLFDTEIGWHAGKWEMNCQSIGIALDNDFTNSQPNTFLLSAIANLIKAYYPDVSKERILGHCEVNVIKNTCPSGIFLFQNGEIGWKKDLLELL